MAISYSGSAKASRFKLNDILVVPDVSRNLLSVNWICKDNDVCVEFDEQRVKVRDKTTREVLAQGSEG